MLRRLYISNYALISEIEIPFEPGFTIITGETGAGKSIIMGALSLLLGERADTRVVSDKEQKSVVEASFVPSADLKPLFEENSLDWDDGELIIRREISSTGRSRAFVNDTPVNLRLLAMIAARQIDIHSQNSNSLLSLPDRRLRIIDAFAGNEELRNRYSEAFREFVKERARLRTIRAEMAEAKDNEEYLRYRLSVLDALNPRPGRLEALEAEARMLADADDINMRLAEATSLLSDPDTGIAASLAKLKATLARVPDFLLNRDTEADSPSLTQRLEEITIEATDMAQTVDNLADNIDNDPARLASVEKEISDYYEAMKRFGAADGDGLARLHKSLKEQFAAIDGSQQDISRLEKHVVELGNRVKQIADELTASRMEAAQRFGKTLIEKVRPLGLPNITFTPVADKVKIGSSGQDEIRFLCSFNKNREATDVERIASGGEMSRLMLGIKAVMAHRLQLPTVIFDEIDTGVSGDIADRMGAMMRDMSEGLQVIAITHLPQVAARGHRHYAVYKTEENDKTVTQLRRLTDDERLTETARMLAGADIDEAARMNARSLLARGADNR